MRIELEIGHFGIYLCIGRIYDPTMDDWYPQNFAIYTLRYCWSLAKGFRDIKKAV